ncbi:methylated-DNA--[protein]-cysteine S-methyltransferase [Archaeoglobus neptunius]|uniref:methylated-DNA--[protein]-cysteine S-methyltransferase n=1 Tax=Archaeoglobus neptunius TaxID=2798580 RepID=UPI001925A6C6|nr:methylated-DNA--[protein]-cysteine S-methyltransferase [Archaeoglobus neptunius]
MSFSVCWDRIYFNVVVRDGSVIRSFFSAAPAFDMSDGEYRSQIEEYFEGTRKKLKIPLNIEVSDFTRKVLKEVSRIPYGKTLSYSEIAEKLKSSPRAVGQAVKRNPVPVIIPCHRVVAKNGLGGYSSGLRIKMKLLELEFKNLKN